MSASDDVLSFLAAVGGEISDPLGRVTAIVHQAMPFPGTQGALSNVLHQLERRGLVARDVRQRRTYAISVVAPAPAPAAALPVPAPAVVAAPVPVLPRNPGPAPAPAATTAAPVDHAREAERAIYSAAVSRARQRIAELEEDVFDAGQRAAAQARRADELQERLTMAEKTIDSMQAQLLQARSQLDGLRRSAALPRRPGRAEPASLRAINWADASRPAQERPTR